MTVSTPIIKKFSGRSVIALSGGQQVQVLPTISWLSRCRKYQSAAFIADRGMLVVWNDDPTAIIDQVSRLEKELLTMMWRADAEFDEKSSKKFNTSVNISEVSSASASTSDVAADSDGEVIEPSTKPTYKVNLTMPVIVAIAIGLLTSAMGSLLSKLLVESAWDGQYIRFALVVVIPLLSFVSLFFFQALATDFMQIFGPIKQLHGNSKFYSGVRPKRLTRHHEGGLPHVTIQMPVYKEGLEGVIEPTIRSIKAAIATYEMQGGTANIFVNDDGLQLVDAETARTRQDFYDEQNIGWVSRPKHNPNPAEGEGEPFLRRGKFKKASNMNYCMWVSTRVEDKMAQLDPAQWNESDAYRHALDEVIAEDEGRTQASGNIRIGDYVLLIDSDTRVPRDCLLDAVSEMEHSPQTGIVQYSSGVMNVTNSYFEKGITFFTNLVYSQIKFSVASGDAAPFVGHNAILRWSAIQYISYDCPLDTREKWWSEATVSEDFDMSLRLQGAGYLVRLAGYTSPDGEVFQEGVSLTVYDEITRWEKYAYGCSELIFHPFRYWFTRGPFTPLFRRFLGSRMPLSSKLTILAYVGTYFAIAWSWISVLLNYFALGWFLPKLDHMYAQSFGILFSVIMVFTFAGFLCLAILRFRGDNKPLVACLVENIIWAPFMTIFIGGLSMHVSQAILCHLCGIDMSWGATAKELENTTFFKEMGKVGRKFKVSSTARALLFDSSG
jgi:membrane glycosyltransferase